MSAADNPASRPPSGPPAPPSSPPAPPSGPSAPPSSPPAPPPSPPAPPSGPPAPPSGPSALPSGPSALPAAAPMMAPGRRRHVLLGMAGLLVVAGIAFAAYWWLVLRHIETTDNAYVQAPLVQITSRIDGTVAEVAVDDTDIVAPGELLVRLDPADARLALERASAALAQAVREVRVLHAQDGSYDAQVKARRADVERARTELARADGDAARREALKSTGAISAEDIRHAADTRTAAQSALKAAQSALAAAEQQAVANRALSGGTGIDQHPGVESAAAAVREAFLTLRRTELRAPLAGQVARRTVQAGQRVSAGAPLMSVIPLDQVWVEANFKEVQLRRMHVGQAVTLTADAYGSQVEYHGRIVGLGAGTGAAFALLPAQNATGNWIKVVQRLPVRIELDRPLPKQYPLRVGLSMQVTVHLDQEASPSTVAAPGTADAWDDAAAEKRDADALVRRIIDANLGPQRTK